MESIADEKHVIDIVRRIKDRVPKLSDETGKNTTSGKPEYSIAVGRLWEEYGKDQENADEWKLCAGRYHPHPEEKHGEYLVDFILFEEGYGARIACESEWGKNGGDVEWDFDKLVGVKADIKVLIYECPDSKLLENLRERCLANNALVSPDEAFVFVRFDGSDIEARWWHPSRQGPFEASEIEVEPLIGIEGVVKDTPVAS